MGGSLIDVTSLTGNLGINKEYQNTDTGDSLISDVALGADGNPLPEANDNASAQS